MVTILTTTRLYSMVHPQDWPLLNAILTPVHNPHPILTTTHLCSGQRLHVLNQVLRNLPCFLIFLHPERHTFPDLTRIL